MSSRTHLEDFICEVDTVDSKTSQFYFQEIFYKRNQSFVSNFEYGMRLNKIVYNATPQGIGLAPC